MRTIIYLYLDPRCIKAGEGDFNGYVLKFFVTNDNSNNNINYEFLLLFIDDTLVQ